MFTRGFPLISFYTGWAREGYVEEFSYTQLASLGFHSGMFPYSFPPIVSTFVVGLGVLLVLTCAAGLVRPYAPSTFYLSVATLLWFAGAIPVAFLVLRHYLEEGFSGRPTVLEVERGGYLLAWSISLALTAGLVSRLAPNSPSGG